MTKLLGLVLGVAILLAVAAWWLHGERTTPEPDEEALLAELIPNEDLLLDLTPRLLRLAEWFQASSVDRSAALSPQLQGLTRLRGLVAAAPGFQPAGGDKPGFVEAAHWPVQTKDEQGPADPWAPLRQLDVRWETLRFGVVRAALDGPDQFKLETKAGARGRHAGGAVYGLKARQDLTFRRRQGAWRLTDWIQIDAHVYRAPQPLFEEVSGAALPVPGTRRSVQRALHTDLILEYARTGLIHVPKEKYAPWTMAASNHYFPAVSVVDYDGDGDDDLFLTARWGSTHLLRNNGDGTFTDATRTAGLHVEHMVNCALFVDLDNDGDKDALLGRAMEPALYMRNDGGTFRDVTAELSDLGSLHFTTAIAATDVNRDGLVDLYLSTYPPLGNQDVRWDKAFLTEEEQALLAEKRKQEHNWLNQIGTSNVLLMNRGGGRLERVAYDDLLSQWHRSFQAGWGDYDGDGDDDLYVCNDFAPDALLRNDTPQGAAQPRFTDVSQSAFQGAAFGFGMGVSWGDYDSDGDIDLYVSNMYSKAGKRIIAHMRSVDPRMKAAAAGNFLFENRDGKLHQRAGSAADQWRVHQVGWSWGGQWADLDNDARLDLYVPSGYYTAPAEVDTEVDN